MRSRTFYGTNCQRCGEEAMGTIMSMFNTEMICFSCKEKEEIHPLYEDAREADAREIMNGNYNYVGIGKPKDL